MGPKMSFHGEDAVEPKQVEKRVSQRHMANEDKPPQTCAKFPAPDVQQGHGCDYPMLLGSSFSERDHKEASGMEMVPQGTYEESNPARVTFQESAIGGGHLIGKVFS